VVGSSSTTTFGSEIQAHREVQAPLHAAGVGADAAVGRLAEPEALDQRVRAAAALGARQVAQPRHQAQVLARGQHLVDGRVLAGEAERAAHLVGIAGDVEAGDPDVARVGLQERREDPHGGGLAGAVGAEQREHRALLDGEVEAREDTELAERLRQLVDLDCVCHTHMCITYTLEHATPPGLDRLWSSEEPSKGAAAA
jgi:hypothetical protein